MKQMMENFPYDLVQKNVKNKNDKKSMIADTNDGSIVNQINLNLIMLYLDFSSVEVEELFASKIISYLKGQFFAKEKTCSQCYQSITAAKRLP